MSGARTIQGIGRLVAATLACFGILLGAGPSHSQRICPLSEQQQTDAQDAFAQLAEVFREDRCSNCHGKQNPFEAATEHPDRQTIELDENGEFSREKTFEPCKVCHDPTPNRPWQTPPARLLWWNASVEDLCRTMQENRKPASFLSHMEKDDFIGEAFNGTMGLNDVGKSIVETAPYPSPPSVTRSEFVSRARAWLAAQGLSESDFEWKGDTSEPLDGCGCFPQLYEIVIEYVIPLPGCSGEMRGTETVPITFTAENKFIGTGSGEFGGQAVCDACTLTITPFTSNQSLMGEIVDVDMRLFVSRTIPGATATVVCPCDNPPCEQTVQIPGGAGGPFEIDPSLDPVLGSYDRDMPLAKRTIHVRKRN